MLAGKMPTHKMMVKKLVEKIVTDEIVVSISPVPKILGQNES